MVIWDMICHVKDVVLTDPRNLFCVTKARLAIKRTSIGNTWYRKTMILAKMLNAAFDKIRRLSVKIKSDNFLSDRENPFWKLKKSICQTKKKFRRPKTNGNGIKMDS